MTTGVRMVGVDSLRRSLHDLLGDHSLLFHRLDRALASQDPAAMETAMRCLALHPARMRQAVEEAMVRWLFEHGPPLGEVAGRPAG